MKFHETIFPLLLKLETGTHHPTFYIIIFHFMHSESSMIIYESRDAKLPKYKNFGSILANSLRRKMLILLDTFCWFWTYSVNWTLSIDLYSCFSICQNLCPDNPVVST